MKVLNLSSKPASYKFSDKEKSFLKKNVNRSKWQIIYCLFTQKSSQNRYVGFFVDYMSNNPRGRTPAHYSMNVISKRNLNDKEIDWEIENYGRSNRRFSGSWVTSILWVIDMDRQYGVETPKEFIDICKEKGYTLGMQQQLKF
jgi:hypothetical protein